MRRLVLSAFLAYWYEWDKAGVAVLGKVEAASGRLFTFRWPLQPANLGYMREAMSTSFLIALLGFFESSVAAKSLGGEAFAGKKAVGLGANNSAHDICADLWENGADVTMIQRSSTHIAPSESLMELALGGLYSEQAVAKGITTDKADLTFASVPYRIMHTFHIPVYGQAEVHHLR